MGWVGDGNKGKYGVKQKTPKKGIEGRKEQQAEYPGGSTSYNENSAGISNKHTALHLQNKTKTTAKDTEKVHYCWK